MEARGRTSVRGIIDTVWVLRKKKDEKGEFLKYKARTYVSGNQQQTRKTEEMGTEHTLETFAPAARSITFKLLCAVGCLAKLRLWQFDVDAAYLQGQFEGDEGIVYVRPPTGVRNYNDRGVPIVWMLLKPLDR
eukprot:1450677-Pleurochrysis_carterae.AAC.1